MIYSTAQEHEEARISRCPVVVFYIFSYFTYFHFSRKSETSRWSGAIRVTVSQWQALGTSCVFVKHLASELVANTGSGGTSLLISSHVSCCKNKPC